MDHSQKEKAKRLLSLHAPGQLLVLPNVWNPITARVLEKKGYSAVATASAAISASLGYEDGEKLKRSTAMDIIGRIAYSVDLPVTADIEAGYGESLSELAETAREAVEAGVVGVNIEDSIEAGGALRPVDEQCERIAALREVASLKGVHLVINARIDSYFSSALVQSGQATEEALLRASAYSKAGADCVYPMGPGDEATVRILRKGIDAPLNILVTPTAAPLAVLQELGVNRASFGPFIFRSCLRKFAEIADELITSGDYSCFSDMMSRAEIGDFLVSRPERQLAR